MNPPETRDTRPLYLQTVDMIRALIARNDLKPGERLPSVEELAAAFSVSRVTVREAISYLENHGILLRKHGVGTFLTKSQDSGLTGGLETLTPLRVLAERAGKKARVLKKQVNFTSAPRDVAQILSVREGHQVIQALTLEAVDRNPCMLNRDYIQGSTETLKSLEENNCSIIDYLRQTLGGAHIRARSELTAVEAEEDAAVIMGINLGRPLLRFLTAYFSLEGDVLAAGVTDFLTEHFKFHILRSTDDLQ